MVSRGCIGRRVKSKEYGDGILSYYGECVLGAGDWCGISLDEPVDGGHDGKIKSKKYFKCYPMCGVMVRDRTVKLLPDTSRKSKKSSVAAMVSGRLDKPSTSLDGTGGRASTATGHRPATASGAAGVATDTRSATSSKPAPQEPPSSSRPQTAPLTPRANHEPLGPKAAVRDRLPGSARKPTPDRKTADSRDRPVPPRTTPAGKTSRQKGGPPPPAPTTPGARSKVAGGKAASAEAAASVRTPTSAKSTRPPQVPSDARRTTHTEMIESETELPSERESYSSPSPVGVAALDAVSLSPRLKRRSLPIVAKSPSPSDWQQRKKTVASDKGPLPKPPQRTSPKVLPATPREAEEDRRKQNIYRDKITMLQADLATALARQKALEDSAKEKRESHSTEIKEQRQQHADALGAFEAQLHGLLAQRSEDEKSAIDRDATAVKIQEMEQSFAKQIHALSAASDKAVTAAQTRASSLQKECDTLRADVLKIRSKNSETFTREKKASVGKSKKLEDELRHAAVSGAKLETKANKLEARAKNLEQKLEASEAAAEKLKRTVAISEDQLIEAEKKASTMVEQLRRRVREQLTNKETECEDITAQVTNLKHELSMSVGKTEQLQRQMEDESSDRSTSHDLIVTRYREQTTSKELECVELQDQVDSLNTKLTRLDALHREATQREQGASAQLNADAERNKSSLSADLDAKRTECDALAQANAAITSRCANLELQLQTQRVSEADMAVRLQLAEDEQAALVSQVKSQNSDTELLEQKFRSLTADLKQSQQDLTKAKLASERATRTAAQTQESAVADARDRAKHLEGALAAASSQAQLLEAKLSSAEKEIAEHEARGQHTENMSEEATKWKKIADGARAELVSLEHVVEIKIEENKAIRVKMLETENRLEEGRADAAKTLSEIVRVQTQKEELVANLEAKRMAHEQAVVDNAHLNEDLKSLEEDMKTLSTENQSLRRKLENYRKDLEKSGVFDAFGTPPSPIRPPKREIKNPSASSTPIRHGSAMFG